LSFSISAMRAPVRLVGGTSEGAGRGGSAGHGSRFSLHLTPCAAEPPRPAPSLVPPTSLTGARIALIEPAGAAVEVEVGDDDVGAPGRAEEPHQAQVIAGANAFAARDHLSLVRLLGTTWSPDVVVADFHLDGGQRAARTRASTSAEWSAVVMTAGMSWPWTARSQAAQPRLNRAPARPGNVSKRCLSRPALPARSRLPAVSISP
jgi:hypothetical protein